MRLLLLHFLEVELVDRCRLCIVELVVLERREPLLLEVLPPNDADNGGEAEGQRHGPEIVCVRLIEPPALHGIFDLGIHVILALRVLRHAAVVHFVADDGQDEACDGEEHDEEVEEAPKLEHSLESLLLFQEVIVEDSPYARDELLFFALFLDHAFGQELAVLGLLDRVQARAFALH